MFTDYLPFIERIEMSEIEKLIKKHEKLRSNGINLIASENELSVNVKKALTSDLAGRYHTEWYGGSKFAQEIIKQTEELAKRLFKAKYVIVTAVSGNICDLAAIFAFTKPNDKVAMLPFTVGGYPLGVNKFNRKRVDIPSNKKTFEIDVDKTRKLLIKERVKLTILGSSFIPFPHPVKEISAYLKSERFKTHCVYDGSHVMGLIACSQFQNPLKEGAEVLFGSTHKTLYGPQGGIVLTNSFKHYELLKNYLALDLESGIGLIDNPHMNRIAALGIAMEEMLKDKGYGKRVIKNAKVLAKALDESGVPVRFKERGYTESHQILLDLKPERAEKFCRELEKSGIFIDIGGRIGTAEVTHRGMGIKDMKKIAELIAEIYHNQADDKIEQEIRKLSRKVK